MPSSRPRLGLAPPRPSPWLGPYWEPSVSSLESARRSPLENAEHALSLRRRWLLRRLGRPREEERRMTGSSGQHWHTIHALLLLGLVVMSPLGLAQSVWAHANLLRAVPESTAVLQQPPARVTLWFR